MRFRNLTDDALVVPSLGLTVKPGDTTPDLSRDEAAGFEGQDAVWEPVKAAAAAKSEKE